MLTGPNHRPSNEWIKREMLDGLGGLCTVKILFVRPPQSTRLRGSFRFFNDARTGLPHLSGGVHRGEGLVGRCG